METVLVTFAIIKISLKHLILNTKIKTISENVILKYNFYFWYLMVIFINILGLYYKVLLLLKR